ncbi:MAG: radical SAM protein [Acidimicrobiales bacterium]|nr:radical SAM protein [Acidimicrobiales bacterium]
MTDTTVTIRSRPDFTPPPRPTRRERMRTMLDRVRLIRFLALLAVKEHVMPDLHVRPLVAELFLTDNCNLNCVSCNCWRTHTRDELSLAEWRSVIDQLADLGFVKLNFTGGEALIRRDACDVISHARSRGFRDLHLNTNGIVLDESRLAEVLQAGIRSFNVSVDGPTAETHDSVRGRDGAFDVTIDAIRRIVARRDDFGLTVQMNFTVLAGNVSLLPAMADLAAELDVDLYLNLGTDTTFLFRHPEVTANLDVDEAQLRAALAVLEERSRRGDRHLPTVRDLRYIPGHFGFGRLDLVPCVESQLKLMVHSTGGVGGCWGHDPSFNLRERSVRSIVDGPEYREEHARLFRKDCVRCGSNYSLNLRARPAGLAEALSRRLR